MMVNLSDLFDIDEFYKMVAQGYVTLRYHNELPLAIANYSKTAQYEWVWNDVTMKTRGLIYNVDTLEVVARPFEKFYNWDEGKFYPPTGPVLRMDKMDGSLGILYGYTTRQPGTVRTEYAMATRGSFHSEQAEWATRFLGEHPDFLSFDDDNGFFPLPDRTYLFEIIFPENRIVVDYGDYKGLVLIDVIDNETGFPDTDEFDNCEWPDKVTRVPMAGFDSGQVVDIVDGNEGFVYLWPTRNVRTKMKSAQYVQLHRLISNLNEKTIWEHFVAGGTLDTLKKDLPEEFHGYIDDKGKAMLKDASAIMSEAYRVYDEIKGLPTRKEQALALAKSEYKGLVFKLLDEKTIWRDCLVQVKPKKTPTEEE